MAKLALYSYFRSSAAYRVRIALGLKDLSYEYRAVHLLENGGEQHKAEFRKMNPSREVPVLLHGDRVIAQSMAIIDYVDREFTQGPRLFPTDNYLRALVMQACEIVNSGAQPVHNRRVLLKLESDFAASEGAREQWTRYWIQYGLEAFEALITPHAGEFSFGDTPGAADAFIIPHTANADRFKVSLDAFPAIRRIRESTAKLDSFRKAAPDQQPDFQK